MSTKSLPAKPSLDHLKAQAKDLLSAAKAGDSAALARFREALPNVPPDLALHDAQSAIAREYGFPSWAALRDRVLTTPSEAAIQSLMVGPTGIPLPRELFEALTTMAEPLPDAKTLPTSLPYLALRDALMSVSTAAPFAIQRPQSLAAVAAAESSDRLIAVFAQRDPLVTDPGLADLHPVGCVARVVRVVDKADGTGKWIVVYGLAWIRLEALNGDRASVAPHEIVLDSPTREAELRARVHAAVAKLPEPDAILRQVERMTPLVLADAAVANAPVTVEQKAAYAAETRLSARIDRAIALIGG